MGLFKPNPPRKLMQTPAGNSVEDFAMSLCEVDSRLEKVPQEQFLLIVGLVLSLIGQYLSFNKELLMKRLVTQLKLRGYGTIQIWLLQWCLVLVIDCLVDWLRSFDQPVNQFRMTMPANLPELKVQ